MTVTRDGVVHAVGDVSAGRLLDDFRRGDFFFGSAQRTLLASDSIGVLEDHDWPRLANRIRGTLLGDGLPLAAGVLPYDSAAVPARLILPTMVRSAGPLHPAAGRRQVQAIESGVPVAAVPEPAGYAASVATAVRQLRAGELRKVVLARMLELAFPDSVPVAAILANLVRDNAHGYTFAAELPPADRAGQRTLLGSSPELLVSRTGRSVISHPLAGSAPRSADPVTDNANARYLVDSAKEQLEHELVVEAVADTLAPYCRNLVVPPRPSLTATSAVWHLGTKITGELRDPELSVLTLAAELHPTPAIGGTPREQAREAIDRLEPFDRDYYAGLVGWVDANGDGQWAIAIRCADIAERAMRLFAGAGIVADSQPERELAETTAKFQTLLRAMGLTLES
nr:isochorismate synthase [Tamaricihabitans halophyticus]